MKRTLIASILFFSVFFGGVFSEAASIIDFSQAREGAFIIQIIQAYSIRLDTPFSGNMAGSKRGGALEASVEATEKSDKVLKMVSPMPQYRPAYLDYINDLYVNFLAALKSDLDRNDLMKILVALAAACAGYWGYRKYFAKKLQGEWMLDIAVMEKHLVHTGASQNLIDAFKQQFGSGHATFIISKQKMTLRNNGRSVDFPYETMATNGEITTGLLDGRMVVMVWTPRGSASRIISLREANEHEIPGSSERMEKP